MTERAAFGAMARIARAFREQLIATNSIEAADAAIPEWELDTLAEAAKPPAEQDAARPIMAAPETMTATDIDPANKRQEGGVPPEIDEAALAAKETKLGERETALAAREAAHAARDRLAVADAALVPHIEAGRILPAERAGLAALLASLPDGDDETIAFAGPDGTGEVREAPRAIVERLLGVLPKRVDFDTLAGGAAPEAAGEDTGAIAREARALQFAATEKGETLSPIEASTRRAPSAGYRREGAHHESRHTLAGGRRRRRHQGASDRQVRQRRRQGRPAPPPPATLTSASRAGAISPTRARRDRPRRHCRYRIRRRRHARRHAHGRCQWQGRATAADGNRVVGVAK